MPPESENELADAAAATCRFVVFARTRTTGEAPEAVPPGTVVLLRCTLRLLPGCIAAMARPAGPSGGGAAVIATAVCVLLPVQPVTSWVPPVLPVVALGHAGAAGIPHCHGSPDDGSKTGPLPTCRPGSLDVHLGAGRGPQP